MWWVCLYFFFVFDFGVECMGGKCIFQFNMQVYFVDFLLPKIGTISILTCCALFQLLKLLLLDRQDLGWNERSVVGKMFE